MSVGLAVRKMRKLNPENPMDNVVNDMADASTTRIRKEVDKRTSIPNTLADEIKKALG